MMLRNQEGFTLIELLVAMAAAALVMAAIVSSYVVMVGGKNLQDMTMEMQQNARAAMTLITEEIRMAGCDPEGGSGAGFVLADTGQLQFTMDIDGGAIAGQPDGDVNDANENVRYQINANGHLGRDTGGGLQPVARNIEVLNFVYLAPDDTNGVDAGVLPDVLATPVAAGNLGDIRTIQVTIIARTGDTAGGVFGDYRDDNVYTNQQGDVILDTATLSDGERRFRRLIVTETVHCRNMGL